MKISINFNSVISFITIILLLFFSVVFMAVKRKHKKANVVFSLVMFAISYNIFDFGFTLNSGFFLHFPHLLRTSSPIMFIIFPLMYLYVKIVTTHEKAENRIKFYHYIPALVIFLINLSFYIKSGDEKIMLTRALLDSQYRPLAINLLYPLFLCQALPYLVFAGKTIKRVHKWIMDNYSSMVKLNLNWLKYIVVTLIMTLIAMGVLFLFSFFMPEFAKYYHLIPVAVSVFSLGFIFKALLQPAIVLGREFIPGDDKQDRNNLYPNMDHQLNKKKLENLMEKQKIFRDPDISLTALAEKMNVRRNYVSFLINELYNLSFYDFINRHRVEEVTAKLQKDSSSNLLHIAFNAGFNSKTTFNVTFKKYTGMTPTQYRHKMKKGSHDTHKKRI